jgi:tetratricopeptide (TPR) repeat protein
VLTSLVDKSLLVADGVADGTRYRLLAPMRAHALELQQAAGEHRALQQMYAQWCLGYVQRAHEAWEILPSPRWSAQFEPEIDNLRACLTWALQDRENVELGQRLVAASRRLWARIFPSEGKRWVLAARQLIDSLTPEDVVAALGLAEAHIHIALQQFNMALSAARECEKVYRKAGDELALAECRGFAGLALVHLGRGTEGEPLIAASVKVYLARGAKQLAAQGVNNLAIAHLIRGDVAAGSQLLREAMGMFRALGNERGVGGVAANLAEVEFAAGNVEAALRLCGDALATAESAREARLYLNNMAAYLVKLGRYDDARAAARESLLGGGIARADVDVALSLQHLAAICAFRSKAGEPNHQADLERAARLIGFVDSRLAAFQIIRRYTELDAYNRLVETLRSSLSSAALEEMRARGRSSSEEDAVREAIQI